jgi:sialic acid synthase SpsE
MLNRFQNNKVIIISEIHPQHHGSMKELKRMIMLSKIGGADYVKVQLYDSKKLFSDKKRAYIQIEKDEFQEMVMYAKNIGIELFASVFNEDRIEWCEDMGVSLYKIASVSISNKKLCQKIIATNKSVIASLGMYNFKKKGLPFKNKNISYLYCVSNYPANLDEIDMPHFKKSFFLGYSDHTIGIGAALFAISRGAKIIEKHFSLNKSISCSTEKAHICSMDFEDLKRIREYSEVASMLIK